MRLKALHQIHVSAVKADSIRPGEEFSISDSAGADLLKRHPDKFEQLEDIEQQEEIPEVTSEQTAEGQDGKQDESPDNKMKGKSKNKSE